MFGIIKIKKEPIPFKYKALLYIAACSLYFAYMVSPILNKSAITEQIRGSLDFEQFQRQLEREALDRSGEVTGFYISDRRFAQYRIKSSAYFAKTEDSTGLEEVKFESGDVEASIRVDLLIMSVAIIVIIFLSAWVYRSDDLSGNERLDRGDEYKDEVVEITVKEHLSHDIFVAKQLSDEMFKRSTLLLIGGITMSFVGVAIFYLTVPVTHDLFIRPSGPISEYLSESRAESSKAGYLSLFSFIRPIGMLIFVQAIAWFLLRQYRSLIEDYKWFHRLYLKRSNYLAAYILMDKRKVKPEDVYLAMSLVEEDLSGKLSAHESTESIERLRKLEESPVDLFLREIFRNKNSSHKSKEGTSESEADPKN